MSRLTPVELDSAIGMLQAKVKPSVIAQQFQCHFMTMEHLMNRFRKVEQRQSIHIHYVIML